MSSPQVVLRDPRAATDILLGHKKVSIAPDVGTPETIMVSDWNDRHIFAGGASGDILTKDNLDPNGARWTSPVMVTGPIPPIDAQYLLLQADPRLPNSAQFVTGPGIGHVGGTISLTDNGVSNAKLRDSGPLSVIGRSVNAPGDPGDITAYASGYVLKRTGDILDFRYLDVNETVGSLPATRISGGAAPTFPGIISTAWFAMVNNNNYLYGANTGGGWVPLIGMDNSNRVHISPAGALTIVNSTLEVYGSLDAKGYTIMRSNADILGSLTVGGNITAGGGYGIVDGVTTVRAWCRWLGGFAGQYGFASGQFIGIVNNHAVYRFVLTRPYHNGYAVSVTIEFAANTNTIARVLPESAQQFLVGVRNTEDNAVGGNFHIIVAGQL